ncbi:MAG: aspartate aminotransferase family protein [Chloroflexota bacterium]
MTATVPKTARAHAAPDQADAEQAARNHVWFHYSSWRDVARDADSRVFVKGEGSTLWDARGNAYLDVISGLWLVNAGHGRREIADAMAAQASQLAYAAITGFTTAPAALLAERLAALTPGDLNRFFFCSGGSEAVETALKIARQVQAMRGFSRRYKFIARRGSSHGMTYGAMSLTAMRNEAWFGPFLYGVSHVPHPNSYRSDFGLTGTAADIAAARAVEQEILYQGPETVAAVIAEPISSAAGLHVPTPVYWRMLRDICDRHGVLLIADEVINGFGRTGAFFAIEHYGIVPDIMTIAKGLSSGYAPIAAAVVRDDLYEIFKDQDDSPLGHLLTFGGHPVSAAAALANLDIFERERLVVQSREKGAYLRGLLQDLRDHPSVGDVRGCGLFAALDLVSDRRTKKPLARVPGFSDRLSAELRARGLLTRVWDVLHVAPPLTTSFDELDRIVAGIDEALTVVENVFAADIAA